MYVIGEDRFGTSVRTFEKFNIGLMCLDWFCMTLSLRHAYLVFHNDVQLYFCKLITSSNRGGGGPKDDTLMADDN